MEKPTARGGRVGFIFAYDEEVSIPDYQTFMLPVLRTVATQAEISISELYAAMIQEFRLSETEQQELLPSGQPIHKNRIAWAKTYMVKAGLLNIPARGRIVITQLGRDFLASKPKALNTKMLFQYPSFAAFQRKEQPEKSEPQSFIAQTQTLDEQLEELYQQHRRGLREEILERIYKVPPTFFERLVIDVLVAMGYGGSVQDAGKAVGKSGDGGIDGIIKQDRLGLENIYIQAKRWQDNVGRPTVNEFAGSLALRKASKGVLITTSDFTDQARAAAATHGNIVLVTGSQLADFMMDYGVGVSTVAQHQIKKVDLDYFEDI